MASESAEKPIYTSIFKNTGEPLGTAAIIGNRAIVNHIRVDSDPPRRPASPVCVFTIPGRDHGWDLNRRPWQIHWRRHISTYCSNMIVIKLLTCITSIHSRRGWCTWRIEFLASMPSSRRCTMSLLFSQRGPYDDMVCFSFVSYHVFYHCVTAIWLYAPFVGVIYVIKSLRDRKRITPSSRRYAACQVYSVWSSDLCCRVGSEQQQYYYLFRKLSGLPYGMKDDSQHCAFGPFVHLPSIVPLYDCPITLCSFCWVWSM